MPTAREAAPSRATLIEIAVDSADDAVAAAAAGADRLEVCAELARHGLTPSAALVAGLKARVAVPVVALVRPLAGGFVVDAGEWGLMLRQAGELLGTGADGIAFGCLTAEGAIDRARCREMVRLCGARDAVFHRAFDLVPDPADALGRLVDAGVRRVLTAGMGPEESAAVLGLRGTTASTVPDPLERRLRSVRSLVEHGRGRIEILACGGVRPGNAARFLGEGGCDQLHSACRGPGAAGVDVAMVAALKAVVTGAAQK